MTRTSTTLLAHRNHVLLRGVGESVPPVCFNLPPGAVAAAAASVSRQRGRGVRSAESELGAVLLGFLALVVVEVEPALLNDGGHPLLVLSPVLLVQLCCQAVGRAVGVGLIQQ